MDDSLFQLLSVDCDMEMEPDMPRVPGRDTLHARTQPTLMLHLPDSCTCECFLQPATSPCVSPSEDELATILDDNLDMVCYENDNFLYEMLEEMSLEADDLTESNSPSSVTQTLDDGLPNGQSLIDFLCDPYIGGDVSSGPDSSEWSLSSPLSSSFSSSDSLDSDMFQLSPNPPESESQLTSHLKRKSSDDVSHDAAKRKKCCHADELFSTLNRITSQPIVSDDLNEMKYGFYVKCEDV